MNWPMISAISTLVIAAAAAWNAWIISQLKVYIAECRAADKKELREWINGSFLRSKEAEANFERLEALVEDLRTRRTCPACHVPAAAERV